MQEMQNAILLKVTSSASHRSSAAGEGGDSFSDASGAMGAARISESQRIGQILTNLNSDEALLASVESFDFDAFKVCESLGREHTFTAITYRLIMNIQSMYADQNSSDSNSQISQQINTEKLVSFLQNI